MALDRLTQITSSGISSTSTITVSAIAGVITATRATVGSGITLSETQINVGSATTIHSSGFRIGNSDLHSTGISLSNINSAGIITTSSLHVGIGGTVITTTSGGNIGIGTTNPGSNKVEIVGNDGGIGLAINNNVALSFKDSSGIARRAALLSPTSAYYYGDVDNVVSGSNLFLLANNSVSFLINGTTRAGVSSSGITVGAGGTIITTTADGLVGIGTTNPAQRLHIQDGSNSIRITGTAIEQNTTSGLTLNGSNASGFIAFRAGGDERARIISNGNIGIGTINPGTKLDIWGPQRTSALNPVSGSLRLAFDGGSNAGDFGSAIVFTQRYDSVDATQIGVGQIAGVKIAGGGVFGGGLVFSTSNGTASTFAERLRITDNGNIGIGTNNPSARLHVHGSATKTSADGGAVTFSSNDAANAFQLVFQRSASTDSVPVWSISSVEQSVAYRGLSLQPNGGNTLIGMGGGNLGVGTANPTNKVSIGVGVPATLNTTSEGLRVTDGLRNVHLSRTGSSYSYGGLGGTASLLYSYDSLFLQADTSNSIVFSTGSAETARITPAGFIQTPNNIGGGLEIGYKKFVTITGSFSANTWYNTGIDRTTDTGIYLLSAYVDTYNTGQSYQMSYIGWFVMPNRATNSGAASNITLHAAGHAPNAEVIQFRTLLEPAVSGGRIYLQWLSNISLTLNGGGGNNIQVAIYKFGTAFNN